MNMTKKAELMKTVIAFSTISLQVVKHGNELKKLEYDINAGAAATTYVQLHDFPTPADLAAGNAAPANGAVPLKSWNSAAGAPNNYKDFTRGEMSFKYGVFVCVSTTEATLTIGTGNNKFDMVSAEVINEEITGTTEVQASGVSHLQVWSEANGALNDYRLIRVAIVNLTPGGLVCYFKLFAVDVASGVPILQRVLKAAGDAGGGDIMQLDFGDANSNGKPANGLLVSEMLSGLVKLGCTVGGGITPSTGVFDGTCNIYAEYK